MGFGFYGRSFQLSDPSCSNPGCQFSGGAAPGPCSDASGVLYVGIRRVYLLSFGLLVGVFRRYNLLRYLHHF